MPLTEIELPLWQQLSLDEELFKETNPKMLVNINAVRTISSEENFYNSVKGSFLVLYDGMLLAVHEKSHIAIKQALCLTSSPDIYVVKVSNMSFQDSMNRSKQVTIKEMENFFLDEDPSVCLDHGVKDMNKFNLFIKTSPSKDEFKRCYPHVELIMPDQVCFADFRGDNVRFHAVLDQNGCIVGGEFG